MANKIRTMLLLEIDKELKRKDKSICFTACKRFDANTTISFTLDFHSNSNLRESFTDGCKETQTSENNYQSPAYSYLTIKSINSKINSTVVSHANSRNPSPNFSRVSNSIIHTPSMIEELTTPQKIKKVKSKNVTSNAFKKLREICARLKDLKPKRKERRGKTTIHSTKPSSKFLSLPNELQKQKTLTRLSEKLNDDFIRDLRTNLTHENHNVTMKSVSSPMLMDDSSDYVYVERKNNKHNTCNYFIKIDMYK